MSKKSILYALICSAGLLSFTSCLSFDSVNVSENQFESAVTEAQNICVSQQATVIAENFVNNFIVQSSLAKIKKQNTVSAPNELPVITKITAVGVYPEIYDVYFGDAENCYTGSDGNKYKGHIIIKHYHYTSPDTIRTSKGVDFYRNDDKINFQRSVSGAGGVLTIVSKDSIIYADNNTSNMNGIQIRKGYSNGFKFLGNSKGKLKNGQLFSSNITDTLVTVKDFKYFVKGIVEVKIGNDVKITNYGNGEKDSLATVTFNGVTKDKYLNWGPNTNGTKSDTIVTPAMYGVIK